jgi:hypothetical protein
MKLSRRPRETASIPDSVHRRLNMYALAASATGASMLALAQPADARIIYTPAHVRIGLDGVHDYHLDINHDGTTDFSLKIVRTIASTFKGYALGVYGHRGNFIQSIRHGGAHWARALTKGQMVNCKPYCSSLAWMAHIRYNGSGQASTYSWINVANKYLGLRFAIKGKSHYGWARLNVKVVGHKLAATLTGYAYETIPNKPIIAGATERPDDASPTASLVRQTPEPVSLGVLARGALGLPIWRREERAAAAKP